MMQKKGRWKTVIQPVIMIFIMVLLFGYMSYSWMRREWTPTIKQDGITIATSGSLVFQMGEGQEAMDGKTINEILNLTDFSLKPVSNLTGETEHFFTLDASGAPGTEAYKHLNTKESNATTVGKENGYLEFTFQLYAPSEKDKEETRYIYLHEDSKIEATDEVSKNVANCIRVSITLPDSSTYIFKNEGGTHTGVTVETNADGKYLADGVQYYETYDEQNDEGVTMAEIKSGIPLVETSTTEIHKFSDYNGKTDGKNDRNKILFEMKTGNEKTSVTVRIWVEGTDPLCTDAITNKQINLMLKFASFTEAELSDDGGE